MTKEDLIKAINDILPETDLSWQEIKDWQDLASRGSEADLTELLRLLKERAATLQKVKEILDKSSEQALKKAKEDTGKIPEGIFIGDMLLADAAKIFRTNLLRLRENKQENLFIQTDHFLKNLSINDQDVDLAFINLRNALLFNVEKFKSSQITIGRFLALYNAFKSGKERTELDRLNFITQNEEARKLNQEERKALLDFLKLYDFLVNPSNVNISAPVGTADLRSVPKSNLEPREIKKPVLPAISKPSEAIKPQAPIIKPKLEQKLEQKPVPTPKAMPRSLPKAAEPEKINAPEFKPELKPASKPEPVPKSKPENPQIQALEQELAKYPVGSLERMAIEAEIKKLKM